MIELHRGTAIAVLASMPDESVARHRIRHASGLEYPEPETPTLAPSTGEADDDLFDLFPDS